MATKRRKQPTMRIEDITVEGIPDPTRHRNKKGKRFGLQVWKFIGNLFLFNEQLPRLKKMTDTEIAKKVAEEYSHYENSVDYWTTHESAVRDARQKHNRGYYTNQPPELLSFRYNNDGERVMSANRKSIKPEAERRYYARYTAFYLAEPGVLDPKYEHRDWMLPYDDPEVVEAWHKLEKKRERWRGRQDMEEGGKKAGEDLRNGA